MIDRLKTRKSHFFPIELLESQIEDLEEPEFNENHITIESDNDLQKVLSNIIEKLRYIIK